MKQIIFIIIFSLTILLDSNADNSLFKPIDYKTIKIEPKKSTLFVPVLTSFSVEYIKKNYEIKNPYKIGQYEVTNEQWDECYKMGGCSHPAKILPEEKKEHPVVRVNWHDAYQFSNWLSKLTGEKYRLPTEEEWIYAVYEGEIHKETTEEYDYSDLDEIQKIRKITNKIGFNGKNNWGVFDAKGNVWEWTLTCWYASEENILKDYTPQELNNPNTCFIRIALGENRAHISDFIGDTYLGGCGTLRPTANLGFRLVKEINTVNPIIPLSSQPAFAKATAGSHPKKSSLNERTSWDGYNSEIKND